MKINFPTFELNTQVYQKHTSKYLFLLHGFTGSAKDWKSIASEISSHYNVIAVDLIGHGKSDSPEDVSFYSTSAIINQLHKVFSTFTSNKIFLLGYSMGGRAALSFAVHYPDFVDSLILESTSPGIKSLEERNKRFLKDKSLVDFLLNNSLEEFTDYWMNLDIFNTQKRFSNEKLKLLRDAKLLNNKTGLANSLLGFSTGIMPSWWDNLSKITSKTLLITGELDTKFTLINAEMKNAFPNARHEIINSAGHNTHLEKPSLFIQILNKFLHS